ncbi:HAD family hydrolase [Saccharicrinis aurantiacus]|uniref:HAD family hydrolase n=1 Tax=Saccharicrinis aurantiacus TaxID=1849719 RepID=UPI002490FD19|nr:HAD family phosphatase [Saccharicrinis aurantiacus]
MSKYSHIKNLIFDLGNVVVDINLDITTKRFKHMGWQGKENFLDKYQQASFFGDFEKGKINSDEFINEIKGLTTKNNSSEEITDAWNALILDYKQERIECILKLKEKYNIYLLSNTNPLHISACENLVPIAGSLNNLFDKLYYSHEMKMHKPNAEIYTSLIEDSNILAEETLFLDDSELNITSAKKLGIDGWHIDDSDAWVAKATKHLL